MTERDQRSGLLRTIDNLHGPAGTLEALLNEGLSGAPFAALVCHPHPLGGGTMHNKVVYHAMKAFQSFGFPVLRFNFRGTGLSQGAHDEGRGEQEDVRAALDWLDREYGCPILFAGFSFGANVGLRVCCRDERVVGTVGLGIPVTAEGREYHYDFLSACMKPKLFISGMRDQYGPMHKVEEAIAKAAPPRELVWISDADHFFQSKLEEVRSAMRSWIGAQFTLAPLE